MGKTSRITCIACSGAIAALLAFPALGQVVKVTPLGGIEGVRVLQGLLSLTKKHRSEDLERACGAAWRHQAFQLRTVRKLLERQVGEQQVFDFLEEHPVIRPMAEYGEFVHHCIQGGIHDV